MNLNSFYNSQPLSPQLLRQAAQNSQQFAQSMQKQMQGNQHSQHMANQQKSGNTQKKSSYPTIEPFYWSSQLKNTDHNYLIENGPKNSEGEPLLLEKDLEITPDLVLYEQMQLRESENDKLLKYGKSIHSLEVQRKMATARAFYTSVKARRQQLLQLSNDLRFVANTQSIWGNGYQGYGNLFTHGQTKLVYPRSRKKPLRVPDIYIPRAALLAQSKQTPDLIPIRLEFDVEKDKFRLRDTLLWDRNEKLVSVDLFAAQTMEEYRFQDKLFAEALANSMKDQIAEYEAFPPPDKKTDKYGELRIVIDIDITVGAHRLVDKLEWDLLLETSPEEVAEITCDELELPGEFASAMAHQIREQVWMYTKALYMHGYTFDGGKIDEEVQKRILPYVNEITWLRGNEQDLSLNEPQSGLDLLQRAKEFGPELTELGPTELEKLDKEREREMRRKRRNNARSSNRRGIQQMPELGAIPKTFRTPYPSTILPGGVDLGPGVEGTDGFYERQQEPYLEVVRPEGSEGGGNNRVRYSHMPGQRLTVRVRL